MILRKYIIPILFPIVIICYGCFSTYKGNPQVSDSSNIGINKNVALLPIIDGRENKYDTDDIKETKEYPILINKIIMPMLKRKGYLPTIINTDFATCRSLENVNINNKIECLDNVVYQNNNMAFIISIDKFSKNNSTSSTTSVYATGVLYDTRSKIIIWKNSVMKEIGNDILMYGIGGGIVNWIAKRKPDKNSDYEVAVNHVVITLIDTVPLYQ